MRHIPGMDAAEEPSAWRDSGVALVGTSAALPGLVFVVVSLHPGLRLLVHALGGSYLVAAGVVLGVLSAMLAIWILFVGLKIEQRER
jgi:hypothetical protein